MNRTGNSIKGPITRANAISGLCGKDDTAIVKAIGEFLANVVRFNATLSSKGNFITLPISCPNRKLIIKNSSNGINIISKTLGFFNINEPLEANIAIMAMSKK